jgi:glutaredoxin
MGVPTGHRVIVLQVYQAEWCPYSHQLRQRLTELGLTFVAHPVAADPERRDEMRAATGSDEIPVVVLDDDTVLAGDAEEIIAALDGLYDEPPEAEEHRLKAAAKAAG